MVEIKQRLDNDDHYDGGNTKEYIVIHDTGNKTDSDEGNANYFCTGTRNASAHYFVDNDSITQVVLDNDCSWHVGDGNGKYGITNRNSLGVEQCRVNGIVTDITVKNTIEFVAMLMKKYNVPIEKVVRHYDASRKNCPASFNLDGKWTKWFEFKQQLANYINPPKPQPVVQPKPVVAKPQPKPVPKPVAKKLYLPASATSWNVYPTNKAPVKANACGALKPSKFGGLTYEILGYPQKDVVTIKTSSFGIVNIYVAPSTGAVIK